MKRRDGRKVCITSDTFADGADAASAILVQTERKRSGEEWAQAEKHEEKGRVPRERESESEMLQYCTIV